MQDLLQTLMRWFRYSKNNRSGNKRSYKFPEWKPPKKPKRRWEQGSFKWKTKPKPKWPPQHKWKFREPIPMPHVVHRTKDQIATKPFATMTAKHWTAPQEEFKNKPSQKPDHVHSQWSCGSASGNSLCIDPSDCPYAKQLHHSYRQMNHTICCKPTSKTGSEDTAPPIDQLSPVNLPPQMELDSAGLQHKRSQG